MQVLMILSQIWKSGANIYLDEKDNQVAIKKQNLIPTEVMKAAEQNYQAIYEWFKSWDDASNEKITIMKTFHQFCGWQHNQKLNEWLLADEDSLQMFYDWTIILAKNGWTDMYEDYRSFENDESNAMARKIYERAVLYAKRGA
ncbi:TPA: hypothetical protein ACR3Z0_004849 [Bacillus thuringiensis]|uniref:Uncharacterized protein n=2 Tax=Bacteria TaxID=2 RepID=A0A9X6KTZ0_BACTU|nr:MULTISPECIES: hypothetical protein [Bacillus cereus group]AJA22219.1 hypothetical protein BT4G5_26335 [Bacillus thuringiensis serovar galleriae]ETE92318.1 hypothetical protein C621_0215085 [Bacillus thuringiensis serovar aizawai str. Leapi01]ETE96287.1 hypothetical protein C623_0220095 [Bacillus thuringiensis serovar aizawai str. Hu4-2]KAB1379658.1 hypothetical protein FPG93_12325 [Bacillus thuringiensis]KLA32095.1 hypothetical protein B4158_2518 [Bacillus cereus]